MTDANRGVPKFDPEELLKQYVYPHLPEDEQFRQNFVMFVFNFLASTGRGEKSNTNEEQQFPNIEIYGNIKSALISDHSLGEKGDEVIEALNFQTTIYLVTTAAKNIGVQSKDLLKKLKKIEDTSKRFLEIIDSIAPEHIALLLGAFSFRDFIGLAELINEKKMSDIDPEEWVRELFFSRADQFREELIYLSEIRTQFTNTSAGQWLQLGMPGPKEHSALSIWLVGLAEIWTQTLGRGLSYKDDKSSGREKFLTFAETCMEPLHAEMLETDTIRNAFEKLRQNGKLDYLSENSS